VIEGPRNLMVVDVETTGLDPKGCGLLEVGAVRSDGATWYARVALERGCRVEPEALEVNGIDALDLGECMSRQLVDRQFSQWLAGGLEQMPFERYLLVGRNPSFDMDFIARWLPESSRCFQRRALDLHACAAHLGLLQTDFEDVDQVAFMEQLLAGRVDGLHQSVSKIEPEPRPHHALRGAIHEWVTLRQLVGLPVGPHVMPLLEHMGSNFRRDEIVPWAAVGSWLVHNLAGKGAVG
jgi:DNA polymerase III epsilon subunit-like protein